MVASRPQMASRRKCRVKRCPPGLRRASLTKVEGRTPAYLSPMKEDRPFDPPFKGQAWLNQAGMTSTISPVRGSTTTIWSRTRKNS
jgi:hypothetical protein